MCIRDRDGVGLAAAHGEDVHALIAALHRHLDVPKAVVPEHLRHVFFKFKARQPQAALRAVAPARHQPPEPAQRPREQQKQALDQPEQPAQQPRHQPADSAQNRHDRRRKAFQNTIQQRQQAVEQRYGCLLYTSRCV